MERPTEGLNVPPHPKLGMRFQDETKQFDNCLRPFSIQSIDLFFH